MKMRAHRKAKRDHAHRHEARRRRAQALRAAMPRPSQDDPSEPVDCADTVDEIDLEIARAVKGYDE